MMTTRKITPLTTKILERLGHEIRESLATVSYATHTTEGIVKLLLDYARRLGPSRGSLFLTNAYVIQGLFQLAEHKTLECFYAYMRNEVGEEDREAWDKYTRRSVRWVKLAEHLSRETPARYRRMAVGAYLRHWSSNALGPKCIPKPHKTTEELLEFYVDPAIRKNLGI